MIHTSGILLPLGTRRWRKYRKGVRCHRLILAPHVLPSWPFLLFAVEHSLSLIGCDDTTKSAKSTKKLQERGAGSNAQLRRIPERQGRDQRPVSTDAPSRSGGDDPHERDFITTEEAKMEGIQKRRPTLSFDSRSRRFAFVVLPPLRSGK